MSTHAFHHGTAHAFGKAWVLMPYTTARRMPFARHRGPCLELRHGQPCLPQGMGAAVLQGMDAHAFSKARAMPCVVKHGPPCLTADALWSDMCKAPLAMPYRALPYGKALDTRASGLHLERVSRGQALYFRSCQRYQPSPRVGSRLRMNASRVETPRSRSRRTTL